MLRTIKKNIFVIIQSFSILTGYNDQDEDGGGDDDWLFLWLNPYKEVRE